jgi:hypothetical protein
MRTISRLTLSFALLALAMPAVADNVFIDELTEGIPTVQVFSNGIDVTGERVKILPDSHDEYLHFKLLINNFGSGDLAYTDLFEDFIGGTISDRILVYFDPNAMQNGGLDVIFGSDPFIPPCENEFTQCTFHYPYDAVEDGTFQHVADAFNTNIGDGLYLIYARSDPPEALPEPGTILLFASGVAGMAARRFCR